MMRIDRSDIDFDSASYIDPTGRVFYREGDIFRAFYPEVSPFYERLLLSDRMKKLIARGKVIETDPHPHLQIEGFGLVVKHRFIDHPSYCFEWPAKMLKDAAVLTLELALEMNEDNIVFQDASPFNIFFEGPKPVFIDVGSFAEATNNYLWAAYQQFCNFFLFPLYLYSSGNTSIPRALLKDCYEGVPVEDVIKTLGLLEKIRMPGYFGRISLPQMVARFSRKLRYRKELDSLYSKASEKIDLSRLRANLLRKLRIDIRSIRLPEPQSDWSDYYEKNIDKRVFDLKKETVRKVLARLAPSSALDIGCNQGVFSILAAEQGAKVVAVDADHDCVNRLFEISKEKGYNILPLVLNILNPSPGIGWRGIQYSPAGERLKCDMVLALALIHHLVFSGGQNFDRIIKSVMEFQNKWCIFEYVDKDDPMAQLLPRRPSVNYDWYTLENFRNTLESHYREVELIQELSETRALILATT